MSEISGGLDRIDLNFFYKKYPYIPRKEIDEIYHDVKNRLAGIFISPSITNGLIFGQTSRSLREKYGRGENPFKNDSYSHSPQRRTGKAPLSRFFSIKPF